MGQARREREPVRIGRLAELTGLTVRTLHHYDRLGLVVASHRTPAGHRLYTAADVERLYRVLALRGLGLPLAGIAAALDGGAPLADLLAAQLQHVDRQLAALDALRARLAATVAAARGGTADLTDDLLALIEEGHRMDETFARYFDADQQTALAERRRTLGEERIAQVQAAWPPLIAEVDAAMAAGTAPEDPAAQALAARWMELLEAFHGGDPGLRDALYRLRAGQADDVARAGGPGEAQIDWIRRADAARRAGSDG